MILPNFFLTKFSPAEAFSKLSPAPPSCEFGKRFSLSLLFRKIHSAKEFLSFEGTNSTGLKNIYQPKHCPIVGGKSP